MVDLVRQWVQMHRRMRNFMTAAKQLNLSPQEKYAYQHHLRNLDRGGVPHLDGSLSSFLNFTTGIGDKQYLLPRVWDNQILSEDDAVKRATADGLEKWPSGNDWNELESRYNLMHVYMERDTDRKLNAHPVGQPPGSDDTGGLDKGPQPAGGPGGNR
jgi:hypothetical protein